MTGGQRIQAGLPHAGKTVQVSAGPDTCQIAVEPGITVTAARTGSRDIRGHKHQTTADNRCSAGPGSGMGARLCCLILPLNPLIARVDGVTLISREIKELIVEQDEKERLEQGAEEELNRQCGDGTVQKVEVLQYGDEPVIEPGQAMVRVILTPTGEDPDTTLHAFEKAHSGAIENLRKTIARTMPFIGRVQLTLPRSPGNASIPSSRCLPARRTAPPRAAASPR